jgi:hypothetical protein
MRKSALQPALDRRRALFFLAGAMLLAAGCGGESMIPVEGKVKHDNKFLTKGSVVLYPDPAKGNNSKHEPRGAIEEDGGFKITTHPRDGAPRGWYKVAVISTEPSDPKNPYSDPRWLIPEKFGKPGESGLVLEVRTGAPAGAYDLELK